MSKITKQQQKMECDKIGVATMFVKHFFMDMKPSTVDTSKQIFAKIENGKRYLTDSTEDVDLSDILDLYVCASNDDWMGLARNKYVIRFANNVVDAESIRNPNLWKKEWFGDKSFLLFVDTYKLSSFIEPSLLKNYFVRKSASVTKSDADNPVEFVKDLIQMFDENDGNVVVAKKLGLSSRPGSNSKSSSPKSSPPIIAQPDKIDAQKNDDLDSEKKSDFDEDEFEDGVEKSEDEDRGNVETLENGKSPETPTDEYFDSRDDDRSYRREIVELMSDEDDIESRGVEPERKINKSSRGSSSHKRKSSNNDESNATTVNGETRKKKSKHDHPGKSKDRSMEIYSYIHGGGNAKKYAEKKFKTIV